VRAEEKVGALVERARAALVVVAALRSPSGASAALIRCALQRRFTLLLSVPLALEYEAVCVDPAQRIVSGLDEAGVDTIISALCSVADPVRGSFLWRPQLRDANDEMVLEAAVNGMADALVTFNRRGLRRRARILRDQAALTPTGPEEDIKMTEKRKQITTYPLRLPSSLKQVNRRYRETRGPWTTYGPG